MRCRNYLDRRRRVICTRYDYTVVQTIDHIRPISSSGFSELSEFSSSRRGRRSRYCRRNWHRDVIALVIHLQRSVYGT